MKLVDVMSGAGLSAYAIVALLLFVIAFVGVVLLTFRPGVRSLHERVARFPLEDDSTQPAPRAGE